MRFRSLLFLFIFFTCISCTKKDKLDDLNFLKKDFLLSIFTENVDESPFFMNYNFRTVFFSKELISLFGEIIVYDHLPHGWSRYEGKTFCRIKEKFQEITLNDLFTTPKQKEFLRSYCESNLKKHKCSYFFGNEPLDTKLDLNYINTFVVDNDFLIIIFQPYVVGGCIDGPFNVKIPYGELKDKWNPKNPLISILKKVSEVKDYTSAFDKLVGK